MQNDSGAVVGALTQQLSKIISAQELLQTKAIQAALLQEPLLALFASVPMPKRLSSDVCCIFLDTVYVMR